MSQEFEEKLIEMISKINININKEQINKFYNYMNLLLEWNKKINLTAITNEDDIILKHFIDSLTIFNYIEDEKDIVDIGTGAGFPSVPLAIMKSCNKFTLVDSLNKRITFLNEIKKELDLKNIIPIHSRAEEFSQNKLYRENYDIAVSRAVARLNILVEYLLPAVKVGGKIICMKGTQIEEELKEAQNAIKELGGTIKSQDTFTLPKTDMERNIIVITKIKPTPKKYPRKSGVPSKRPL